MNSADGLLTEPPSEQASDRVSTGFRPKYSKLENLRNYWYVASLSDSLKHKPLARTVAGQAIVLFRDPSGQAHALLDLCCHRSVPLSIGKVTANGLQCGYHGWEFSPRGQCIQIPGQWSKMNDAPRGCVPSFSVREQDGLVWVYAQSTPPPQREPFTIPFSEDPAYGTLRLDFGSVEATLDNMIDNFMDSLHTPFVHKGLMYDDKKRNPLEIVVRPYRHPNGDPGVEGYYLGEPPPTQGWFGRIFADRSTRSTEHAERYITPTLTQVEYRMGTPSHLLSTQVLTPETPTRTHMYLVLRTKFKLPKQITRWILRPLLMRLIRQDIRMLELQQRTIESSRKLPHTSSELDLLSLTAVHFFNQIADGTSPDDIQIKPQRYGVHI